MSGTTTKPKPNKAKALDHLAKARACVKRSDEELRVAAEHVLDALDADPRLTLVEVGTHVGKSRQWVGVLLRWYAAGGEGPLYADDTPARLERAMAQGLRLDDWSVEEWQDTDYKALAQTEARRVYMYARKGLEAETATREDVAAMAMALRVGADRLDALARSRMNTNSRRAT